MRLISLFSVLLTFSGCINSKARVLSVDKANNDLHLVVEMRHSRGLHYGRVEVESGPSTISTMRVWKDANEPLVYQLSTAGVLQIRRIVEDSSFSNWPEIIGRDVSDGPVLDIIFWNGRSSKSVHIGLVNPENITQEMQAVNAHELLDKLEQFADVEESKGALR